MLINDSTNYNKCMNWALIESVLPLNNLTMASKTIIADLNKGDKLNGDNYDTWRHKIWYVLKEQDALDGINQVITKPGVGNSAQ